MCNKILIACYRQTHDHQCAIANNKQGNKHNHPLADRTKGTAFSILFVAFNTLFSIFFIRIFPQFIILYYNMDTAQAQPHLNFPIYQFFHIHPKRKYIFCNYIYNNTML